MENFDLSVETINKFNVPGPRYTSYPTAPEWKDEFTENNYFKILNDFGEKDEPLSIYIHIPFCESLCWYCGCNVKISKNRDKANDYIDYLFKEIDTVASKFSKKKEITQFHWGGGTPTFMTEEQITKLFRKIQNTFDLNLDEEVAIEVDPRTIDHKKLKLLRNLGFNRVSMGVQDFNPKVQKAVNRVHSYELVKSHYDYCRELGFKSVNLDLIYGLPHQTVENFAESVELVCDLRPDRVALYSYAHLPWLKPHMKLIQETDLPSTEEKFKIFLKSREIFMKRGYLTIAMDHFALETDEMAKAFVNGTLHRNFMGYTLKPADNFIGFGVSSIGYLENCFIQNTKDINEFYQMIDDGNLPLERGKILNKDDLVRQWTINSLMCKFKIDKKEFKEKFNEDFDSYFEYEKEHLQNCEKEDLLALKKSEIIISPIGRLFIRNVCMGFDWYFRQQGAHKKFSKTV